MLSEVNEVIIIALVIYSLISLGIIIFGIWSIITRSSHVYRDNDSNIGKSPLNGHPLQRIIPHDNVPLFGDMAVVMGWVYIILGVGMLLLMGFSLFFI